MVALTVLEDLLLKGKMTFYLSIQMLLLNGITIRSLTVDKTPKPHKR